MVECRRDFQIQKPEKGHFDSELVLSSDWVLIGGEQDSR
jgi:hypothetical protein